MTIGICDDELEFVSYLTKMIQQILDKQGRHCELVPFTKGTDALAAASELDLLFLDMDMPDMDGVRVGKAILSQNLRCKVILVTSRDDRYKEGFQIHALRFVTKPVEPAELSEALNAVFSAELGNESITLYLRNRAHLIPQREIDFLEAYDGYTRIYCGEILYRREEPLQQVARLLDSRLFVQISRSRVVNMSRLQYKADHSICIGKQVFPISRTRRKVFEETYARYDLEYGRYQ